MAGDKASGVGAPIAVGSTGMPAFAPQPTAGRKEEGVQRGGRKPGGGTSWRDGHDVREVEDAEEDWKTVQYKKKGGAQSSVRKDALSQPSQLPSGSSADAAPRLDEDLHGMQVDEQHEVPVDTNDDDLEMGDGEGDDYESPSPEDLRVEWVKRAATVRLLARDGLEEDDEVMVAAIAARDGAKERWEAAKEPTPLSRRFQKADQALGKARKRVEQLEANMDELDREYDQRRQELVETWRAAKSKVRGAEEKLETVRTEVAVRPSREHVEDEASTRLRGTLRAFDGMGPVLLAVAEGLPSDSSLKAKLQEQVLLLDAAHGAIASVAAGADGGAEVFDMADDDGDDRNAAGKLADGNGGGSALSKAANANGSPNGSGAGGVKKGAEDEAARNGEAGDAAPANPRPNLPHPTQGICAPAAAGIGSTRWSAGGRSRAEAPTRRKQDDGGQSSDGAGGNKSRKAGPSTQEDDLAKGQALAAQQNAVAAATAVVMRLPPPA